MMGVEDQEKLERNIQRTRMFNALRKISAIAQEVENEERNKAKAIKFVSGALVVIVVVALFYGYIESNRIASPPHVASNRFTNYVDNWAKQVQAKLRKNCINFNETDNQGEGVVLSTSIMKDGSVEKVTVTKSSGIKEVDEAAVRGVLAASPFAPLPPEIKRDTDILTITRTFRRELCPQQ